MGKIYIDGVLTEVDGADETYYLGLCSEARATRDTLLTETDWWATSDRTLTTEQTTYRQDLRDITGQADFPHNITWPTKP